MCFIVFLRENKDSRGGIFSKRFCENRIFLRARRKNQKGMAKAFAIPFLRGLKKVTKKFSL